MADNPNTNNGTSEQSQTEIYLKQIVTRLNEANGLLRSQRDILRQRGINLPSGAMENLRAVKKQIDLLNRRADAGHGELRSLRALAQTTALINSSLKPDEVLNQVMDKVIELTRAERGYIVLQNEASGELEFPPRVARGIDQSALDNSKGMIISKTIVSNVADTGEPVLTDNASQDKRYQSQESIVGFSLRSILAVPLKARDRIIGVVYCDNRFMAGLFKQTELELLTAFANQAAVAIENANLFESARQSLNEVSAIRERMDNLFTSIASGVITIDEQECILISNAAAEAIVGRPDMNGSKLRDVLPPMADTFYQLLTRVCETGQQESFECTPIINESERSWMMIAAPLRSENGKRGVAIVIDDMTEQKQSESQLIAARRYLPLALVENMRNVNFADVGSQEREITAFFADVRGFTTFSENLEPEELMQVINKYLSLASDAINLFEGIVDKYMGDAVTGLWNTQLNPQADHAVRAIQTALQLVSDLNAQHEVMPEDERLFYGIGIHTGPAVLGNVGGQSRKEFSALGEATDVCKYLQEQAGPGEIIISTQTYALVEDQFECEPSDVKRAKKGYEHINCYRVIKRKPGGPSLFVDHELLELLGESNEDE